VACRRATRFGYAACAQIGWGEPRFQARVAWHGRAVGTGPASVPWSEQQQLPWAGQRRSHRRRPGSRTETGDNRDWHVGGLAGRRGAPVVQVQVPVEIGEPDRAQRVPAASQRAREYRAAAACQQRDRPRGHQIADLLPDGCRELQHRRPAQHSGASVPDPADQPDRQVTAVHGTGRLRQAGCPQRRWRQLGTKRGSICLGSADAVLGRPHHD
jgi:hypothetical protein